jgi:hypothetical protein
VLAPGAHQLIEIYSKMTRENKGFAAIQKRIFAAVTPGPPSYRCVTKKRVRWLRDLDLATLPTTKEAKAAQAGSVALERSPESTGVVQSPLAVAESENTYCGSIRDISF